MTPMTKNQKPPNPPPQKKPNKTGNQQQSSLRDWSDQASTALEGKYLERLHRSQSGGDVRTPWLGCCDTSVALSCCFFVFIRVSFNKSEGFSASALNMYGVSMCLLEQKKYEESHLFESHRGKLPGQRPLACASSSCTN